MARAYGTMTVSEITDIIDVYFEYSLAVNSATVTNSYAFNQVGELGWTVNGQSRKVPPTWVEGYRVWVREVKIKANVSEKIYGTPYPDTAVNEISNNLVEYLDSQGLTLDILNSKIRYMWKNLNNHTYAVGGWTKPDYPAGTYAASGKYNSISETYAIDYEDSSTYGFNTYLSNTALNLRYDNINMTTLSTSDLTFYYPKQINGAYVQGESGLKLSTNGLVLYNRGDGTEASRTAATLNTTGLILKEGGIKAGTAGQSGFIYLSTAPLTDVIDNHSAGQIPIDGYHKQDWKQVIGTNFAVDANGNLYANEAHISGAIKATSGIIGNNAQNKIIISDNIANASIYSGSHSTLASTVNGFYIGTDGLSIGSNFKVTTAGALTASDLTVNSGSIANSVTIGGKNQSEYLNDNIEVGGRNLLYNSGTMPAVSSGDKGWRASGGTVSHIDISTPPIAGVSGGIRCTNTGSSAARVGIVQDLLANRFIAGKKYSMGCWIRASAEFSSDVTIQPIWISSSQTTNSKHISMTLNTNWQYISAEGLTLAGDQASSYSAGYVYASNVPASGYIEVCGIMLEEGTKCTSWTPAPEDVASDIDDASKVAKNYLKFTDASGLDIGYTGKTERTNIKADGMRIYDANSTTDPVASFLGTGSQIGRDGESRIVLTPDGQSIISDNDVEWFNVKKSGHPSSERYKYSEKGEVAASPSISLSKAPATGTAITVVTELGTNNMFIVASRRNNTFTAGTSSSVTNTYVDTSGGTVKWTVSYNAQNNGTISAKFTTANGWTDILLNVSYLTDSQSIDLGIMSFGYVESAEGNGSILLGRGLSGGSDNQLIIGRHNIKDSANKYAFIIGNGSEETSSNALTIDWNGDIYPRNTKMVDFITAQGSTTGGTGNTSWRYRKWKSGRIEAWAEVSFGSVAPDDAWVSPIHYIDKTITIPSGIFSFGAAPSNIFITGGGSQWTPVGTYSIGTTSFTCRFIKPSSSSQPLWVRVYAIRY